MEQRVNVKEYLSRNFEIRTSNKDENVDCGKILSLIYLNKSISAISIRERRQSHVGRNLNIAWELSRIYLAYNITLIYLRISNNLVL